MACLLYGINSGLYLSPNFLNQNEHLPTLLLNKIQIYCGAETVEKCVAVGIPRDSEILRNLLIE